MRYSRAELTALLAARKFMQAKEGTGENAWIELRIRVSPELLDVFMRGWFVSVDGAWVRLKAVDVNPNDVSGFETERVNKPEGY